MPWCKRLRIFIGDNRASESSPSQKIKNKKNKMETSLKVDYSCSIGIPVENLDNPLEEVFLFAFM